MRQYVIAGNWKMNTVLSRAEELAQQIKQGITQGLHSGVSVIVFPPSVFIHPVAQHVQGTRVKVGAQNCSNEPYGAFTGEISADMITSVGGEYTLIGHSERRVIYKESNDVVAAKVKHVLTTSLTTVLCIGETLQERQSGQTWTVLQQQLDAVYTQIDKTSAEKIIIAYEPVWAIGTGVAATKEEAQEAHNFIRKHVGNYIDSTNTMILYGGSVTADNADQLLSQPDINGALIGGASLKAESFLSIIATANKLAG